jgi:predicted RNase H-like nuclease (RuvC/YqgF family)
MSATWRVGPSHAHAAWSAPNHVSTDAKETDMAKGARSVKPRPAASPAGATSAQLKALRSDLKEYIEGQLESLQYRSEPTERQKKEYKKYRENEVERLTKAIAKAEADIAKLNEEKDELVDDREISEKESEIHALEQLIKRLDQLKTAAES